MTRAAWNAARREIRPAGRPPSTPTTCIVLGTDEAAALPSPAVVLSARLNQYYTGVRVAELVAIRLDEVDLDAARIRITHGKGGKDRVVPFPQTFRETLALHIADRPKAGGAFCSSRPGRSPTPPAASAALLARYAAAAGLPHKMPPHRLRHFLFTWLKTQGIDDALIQPYSGHASRHSLEIYSRLALTDAQASYDQAIGRFPV